MKQVRRYQLYRPRIQMKKYLKKLKMENWTVPLKLQNLCRYQGTIKIIYPGISYHFALQVVFSCTPKPRLNKEGFSYSCTWVYTRVLLSWYKEFKSNKHYWTLSNSSCRAVLWTSDQVPIGSSQWAQMPLACIGDHPHPIYLQQLRVLFGYIIRPTQP